MSPICLDFAPEVTLNSRYEIVKGLGRGTRSTVWLANDTTSPGAQVAIKCLRNDVTAGQGSATYELEVLEAICKKTAATHSETVGPSRVLQLLDHFVLDNETSGQHLCFVTKPLGMNLLEVQKAFPGRRMPVPLVQHVVKQLLEGLAFIHDDCRVVHTDIKQDNIMFDNFGDESGELSDAVNVVLADFDTAVPEHGDRKQLIQPQDLRAPEVLMGCDWGTSADIWNMGCITFELITGCRLFRHEPLESDKGHTTPEQGHFAMIESFLVTDRKDLDARIRFLQYFSDGENFEKFIDRERGYNLHVSYADQEPLGKILRVYDVYDEQLEDFLRSMLQIHPDDRASARKLLKHPWLSA
ncbi:kinase-like protein [Schizophyllum commune H4-8]|uniref:Protein kinase domain-containing protein n=1 Tax=Schizophyllum commune (strain H4-8 / FGSC 9210) TaxID=578458 RepID=D8PMM9_SCHCM|nr:kinase-like protein [Schizophyllum commune H4-8]KAI5898764.1 kinase-like protein [Schizophyllum commune H4-8]